ncbi:acyl-CoA dehydrogenase family protein [Ruegeria sp.]|uniref:acyl-CoA dehydrogenase family protein n=1 Tax=Ruegeria sp. TaxID=1879320 RepID=UPI003C7BCAC1
MFDDSRRPVFNEDHNMFRDQVRTFLSREVEPYHEQWERDGMVSREVWDKAAEAGILCPTVAEEDGGLGLDTLFSVVIIEELGRIGASGPGFWIHSEMVAPYIQNFGSKEQRTQWLPKMISGEAIGAVAMTEPGAGSDLKGIRSSARREGNGWLLNGQKVFISNGQMADVVVTAAKTEDGRISLFLVDAKIDGFRRGKNLDKLGAHAQDTSELFFDNMHLPADALLGEEGKGFSYLMRGLARERMSIAASCVAKAEGAFAKTVDYVKDRRLFNQGLLEFQNTRFALADVKTELTVGRAYVDDLLRRYIEGDLDGDTAAMAKLWTTEMLGRTVDACLQLHGGWGYMNEYAICKAYADARVERIAGGASEVMREIIGRTI